MEPVLAILIGFLFAAALYCLLRRSLMKLVIGLILLSQAANLLVFTSGGLNRGEPALINLDEKTLERAYGDPLPQALVLTAIVIGFGLIAFVLALLYRAYKSLGCDDVEAFNKTDAL